MAFCVKCGTQIGEGANFCPNCGTPIATVGVEINQDKAVNIIQTQSAGTPFNQNTPMANTPIAADEKYCFSCGSVIKKAAEVCPRCGVHQSNRSGIIAIDVHCISCGKMIRKEAAICPYCGVPQASTGSKQKNVAILLGIFLGGAHRIYVGKIGTGIPMILLYLFGYVFLFNELYFGFIFVAGWLTWLIIDIVGIAKGTFKDSQGRSLT